MFQDQTFGALNLVVLHPHFCNQGSVSQRLGMAVLGRKCEPFVGFDIIALRAGERVAHRVEESKTLVTKSLRTDTTETTS
jgi:hypothetical protein